MFCKKDIPKNFTKFTGKHLWQSLIIKKETLTQVFSCEFCENFKNTFYYRNLRWLLMYCASYRIFSAHRQAFVFLLIIVWFLKGNSDSNSYFLKEIHRGCKNHGEINWTEFVLFYIKMILKINNLIMSTANDSKQRHIQNPVKNLRSNTLQK